MITTQAEEVRDILGFDGEPIGVETECPYCGTMVKAHYGIQTLGFYYPKSVSCEHVDYVVTLGWRSGGGRFVFRGRS